MYGVECLLPSGEVRVAREFHSLADADLYVLEAWVDHPDVKFRIVRTETPLDAGWAICDGPYEGSPFEWFPAPPGDTA